MSDLPATGGDRTHSFSRIHRAFASRKDGWAGLVRQSIGRLHFALERAEKRKSGLVMSTPICAASASNQLGWPRATARTSLTGITK